MPAASTHLNHFIIAEAPARAAEARPGLLSRLLRRFHDAQMRRAEREVARFIQNRGGRITDTIERQIETHFV